MCQIVLLMLVFISLSIDILGEGFNTVVKKAIWRQKHIAVKLIKDSVTDRLEMEASE